MGTVIHSAFGVKGVVIFDSDVKDSFIPCISVDG